MCVRVVQSPFTMNHRFFHRSHSLAHAYIASMWHGIKNRNATRRGEEKKTLISNAKGLHNSTFLFAPYFSVFNCSLYLTCPTTLFACFLPMQFENRETIEHTMNQMLHTHIRINISTDTKHIYEGNKKKTCSTDNAHGTLLFFIVFT